MDCTLKINLNKRISKVEDTLYSSFVEHMGRAVYTGIYEKGHKTADENGFRNDVLDLVKGLDLSLVRYPGGNFVSGYDWKDGIGPIEKRPVRLEMAWNAIEPNQIGIDEFCLWCDKAGVKPMIAVNLGTGTPLEAARLLEYCNAPAGSTTLAKLREENGHKEPYGIKYWCLGNEMDGPWQICAKKPVEYARIANETAKLLKIIDPSVKIIACGSSYRDIPTFGVWEREVLRECWDHIDYLSLHSYYSNNDGDTASFLSRSQDMDDFIREVGQICDEIAAEKKSDKKIGLSFDEWNVWYHYQKQCREKKREDAPFWVCPRAIEEEDYDQDDSLVVFALLTSLINNSDRVKISCFAQLVNVIAPITTVPEGEAYTRSIYWPLHYVSKYARGTALEINGEIPKYTCKARANADLISSSAVLSEDGKNLCLLMENKSLTSPVSVKVKGFSGSVKDAYLFEKGQKGEKPSVLTELMLDNMTLAPASWLLANIQVRE